MSSDHRSVINRLYSILEDRPSLRAVPASYAKPEFVPGEDLREALAKFGFHITGVKSEQDFNSIVTTLEAKSVFRILNNNSEIRTGNASVRPLRNLVNVEMAFMHEIEEVPQRKDRCFFDEL